MGKHETQIQVGDRVEITGQRFGRVLGIDAERNATIRLDTGKVIDLQRFHYWVAPDENELNLIAALVRSKRSYANLEIAD